ncbi:General secretion pathway protein D [Anaerohalosphaera lusitana]|uniref:General secretion pathway protein D n=1 Tax=Anaerohalosphaera lusitana TaxID=1936003 RepID=A0A1U9NJ53_9BACT|nr:hypothetical protein [Anaerohalosphaera lusitana]AQT67546.1 General secretion pathway protein D [Anaerohalosphaera lusitana]
MGKTSNSIVGRFSGHFGQGTALAVALVLCTALSGCGDFFAEKPTELESRNILRELSEVRQIPDVDNPVPDEYKKPPEIIESVVSEDETDAKLFYFTKYHTPDKLQKMIDNQFLKSFRNSKGKEYPLPDYQVTSNEATNQLVVRCPTRADAEQVLEFLKETDVPPIQVKIDCLISEVYADNTMDWETSLQVQNLLGEGIALNGEGIDTNNDGIGDRASVAFPGAALRDNARSLFGLKAGIERQVDEPGHVFRALVDMLASRGYLKILMNPELEVVNGQTATIIASEQVPLDQIARVNPNSDIITKRTEYIDVVDTLEITPQVFADGSIGIRTRAIIGSKATPEGVKQIPIVTKREVRVEENRIRQGESLVIGGIKKTEKRSVVRGVPFLKDIPIIGVLFSSKDFEERGKEVLFILTPTISSGGVPNEEIVKMLRKEHESVKKDSLVQTITDPFGSKKYTTMVEEEASESQVAKVKAEMERSQAQRRAQWLARELKRINEQLQIERRRAREAEQRVKAARQAYEEVEAASVQQLQQEQEKGVKLQKEATELQKQMEQARQQAAKAQEKVKSTSEKMSQLEQELAEVREQDSDKDQGAPEKQADPSDSSDKSNTDEKAKAEDGGSEKTDPGKQAKKE